MDDFDGSIEIDDVDTDDIDSNEDISLTESEYVNVENTENDEIFDVNTENEVVDISKDQVDIEDNNVESDVKCEEEQNSEVKNSFDEKELQEYLEKESPYSGEVNEYISSPEELQVYIEAGLVERNIDGRICLVREDLDLDYVDKQSKKTNAQLIAKGRSPYDSKTGERIELHHMGQDFNGPFVELKSFSEHDLYTKTLHKSKVDSWRRDTEKVNEYAAQRKAHWKTRSEDK